MLLKLRADADDSFAISNNLVDSTLEKIMTRIDQPAGASAGGEGGALIPETESRMKGTNGGAIADHPDSPPKWVGFDGRQSLVTGSRIRRFPKPSLYALAAGLLIVVSGLAYVAKTIHTPHVPAMVSAPADSAATGAPTPPADGGSLSQAIKVWLDTIRVKDGRDVGKRVVMQEKGTTLRLGGKSGIVAEPQTVLHLSDRTDTTAIITLERGGALFTVEKKRYRRFCVMTPHVRIIVTGTVFSVRVDSVRTKVDVFEGSVQVVPLAAAEIEHIVEQGDELTASGDSIAATEIMNRLTAQKRGRMLLDYLQSTVFGDNTGKKADSSASSKRGN
jgi:hypothetical protein